MIFVMQIQLLSIIFSGFSCSYHQNRIANGSQTNFWLKFSDLI
uniref:Uncharacterized protein n=1 Tax=Arundo donax TaxID=35708 RepID=A0A0A9AL26_ARUDO